MYLEMGLYNRIEKKLKQNVAEAFVWCPTCRSRKIEIIKYHMCSPNSEPCFSNVYLAADTLSIQLLSRVRNYKNR